MSDPKIKGVYNVYVHNDIAGNPLKIPNVFQGICVDKKRKETILWI
jgi:hypothetical protein